MDKAILGEGFSAGDKNFEMGLMNFRHKCKTSMNSTLSFSFEAFFTLLRIFKSLGKVSLQHQSSCPFLSVPQNPPALVFSICSRKDLSG